MMCKILSISPKHPHLTYFSFCIGGEKSGLALHSVHEILPSNLKFLKEWFDVEKSPFWREKNVLSRLENEVDFFSFLLDIYDRLC